MAKQAILDPEKRPSFVDAYMYAIGESEVPKIYHLWCAYSLIAACMGRDAYYEKGPKQRLLPNLYTFLIGSSGSGKNVAIDFAYDLAQPVWKALNPHRGNITAKGLIDLLGKKTRMHGGASQDDEYIKHSLPLWLITPELSMSVGHQAYADSLIKHLTEMFSGKDYPLADVTRTKGRVIVNGPAINWLAGTVPSWLIEAVPRSAIEGGFFARCIPVVGKRDFDVRFTRQIPPPNFDEMWEYLQERLLEFCDIGGQFSMTDEARSIDDAWYMSRVKPYREDMEATWTRQQDLAIKLSMLNSLADESRNEGGAGMIRGPHISLGQRLSEIVMRNTPQLIDLAGISPYTQCGVDLEKLIRKRGRMMHSAILKHMSTQYTAQQINEAEKSLFAQNKIKIEQGVSLSSGGIGVKRQARWVSWRKQPKLLGEL